MHSRIGFFGIVFFFAISTMNRLPQRAPEQTVPVDSLVLERMRCPGGCPAYRLRLSRTGEVVFVSRNPGETLSAVDTVPPSTLDSLQARAERGSFFSLPDMDAGMPPLCTTVRTDAPTLVLGFYGPKREKRVRYYTGCVLPNDGGDYSAVDSLRRLASAVDSATGAGRWIRPGRLR